MKQIVPLLMWRYLRGTRHSGIVSTMAAISFFAILIGTFAFTLILFIMHGMEYTTHQKLQGIHAQIIMRSTDGELNLQAIAKVLKAEFPQIAAFSPTTLKQAIIQSDTVDDISNVMVIKAIDPATESLTTILQDKIITASTPPATLKHLVTENQILIGKKTAEDLHVTCHDTLRLLFCPDDQNNQRTITFAEKTAAVGGIFSTGIDEFDSGLIICSADFLHTLWPYEGPTQIHIKLKPHSDEQKTIDALRTRFKLDVFSWKELYPALVAALKLEKYAIFFILILIILIASANIISLSYMQLLQKRGDIALLRAMGMPTSTVQTIFIAMSMSLTTTACIMGLVLASGIGFLIQRYPCITLPDTYYYTHLPICIEWHLIMLVFCTVVTLSFIATWLPVRTIKGLSIAHILRHEG